MRRHRQWQAETTHPKSLTSLLTSAGFPAKRSTFPAGCCKTWAWTVTMLWTSSTVHERFATDLTHLHEHWSDYFGPEGFSCWNGLVIIPAAVIGGVVVGIADLPALWGVAITVALLAAWVWVERRWGPPDRTVPITVGDVVAAVETGAWPSRS